MSLRFNESRDGVVRATVRTTHRVDPDLLVYAVADHWAAGGEPPSSRAAVEELVRMTVWHHGNNIEDVGVDAPPAITVEAAKRVVSLFPELATVMHPRDYADGHELYDPSAPHRREDTEELA